MIGYISGRVVGKQKNYLILETGGVGYRIFVTPEFFHQAKAGEGYSLFIHHYVREDIQALYGFASLEALDFFELLLTVSGVGPKVALSILSLSDIPLIKSAIMREDPDIFTKVSGVGRKTAERLIMELKGKIGAETGISSDASSIHSEVMDALVALGYSINEARRAMAQIPKDITDSGEKIRQALKFLSASR